MRFLFVDRLLQLSLGTHVVGVKHITPNDYYLFNTDNHRVALISSFIGETIGQLAAWNVMKAYDFQYRPVAGMVGEARIHRPAYVGETLLLEATIDALDETAVRYHGSAKVGNEVIFLLEDALGPMLPMAQFIDAPVVQRQFDEINRPGAWDGILQSTDLLCVEALSTLPAMCYDQILTCIPGEGLTAAKCITRAAPYFADHFPNCPVLPMTVLLECKMNLAKIFLQRSMLDDGYQITTLRKIKMNEFVRPGDVIITHLTMKSQKGNQMVLRFRSEVDGKRVCVLDMVLTATGDA